MNTTNQTESLHEAFGKAVLALYRKLNPRSRAMDHTTWYGSGATVRRATCIYCRKVVATSCGRYRETKASERARHEHTTRCMREWLEKIGNA